MALIRFRWLRSLRERYPNSSFIPSLSLNLLRVRLIRPEYSHVVGQWLSDFGIDTKTARLWPSGVKLKVDLRNAVDFEIYLTGSYEKNMVAFLAKKLQGGVFFDVGANIGTFSLGLCKIASHIHAFEALGNNIERLRKTVQENGLDNVSIVHGAVSYYEGQEVQLFSYTTGAHSDVSCLNLDGRGNVIETVKTVTIDNYVKRENIERVDVIKIDIEGSEPDALKGATETINRFHPLIVCELNVRALESGGSSCAALCRQFELMNYEPYQLVKGRVVKTDKSFKFDAESHINLIFIANRKTEEDSL